ncbi:hypothetical protein ABFT80_26990 [Mesorhizobium sp. SB112]|uniref:hypothetical protein n=1 Tax=Mesorhizobium sp. SB112 TaxID=3151853 RepID=UPI0032652BFD
MDEKYADARENLFAAMRSLAASADSIQNRLIDANSSILAVTIDEFEGDGELKIKFARILDLYGVDLDDTQAVATETAAYMSDFDAIKLADLICDLFYELR